MFKVIPSSGPEFPMYRYCRDVGSQLMLECDVGM